MSELVIKKLSPYIWRVNSRLDQAWHAHVDSWVVEDSSTGEVLAGGHTNGNNVQSGRVFIERKYLAQAFIDGFKAYENGDAVVSSGGYPELISEPPVYVRTSRAGRTRRDHDSIDWYAQGAITAYRKRGGSL